MLNLVRVSNTHHHLQPFDYKNGFVIVAISIGNCTVQPHEVCGSSIDKACMTIQSHVHCSLTRDSVICLQCRQFSACCHPVLCSVSASDKVLAMRAPFKKAIIKCLPTCLLYELQEHSRDDCRVFAVLQLGCHSHLSQARCACHGWHGCPDPHQE